MSDEEQYFECGCCGLDTLPKRSDHVDVGDERFLVCEGCIDYIQEKVENYHWYDRYTEEHHEQVLEHLEEMDEILCIEESYDAGEVWVHTNYVNANVVKDLMDHYGLQVDWWGPRWAEQETWDCLEDHGSCFEICMSYGHHSPHPMPLEAPFNAIALDWLDENDEQF